MQKSENKKLIKRLLKPGIIFMALGVAVIFSGCNNNVDNKQEALTQGQQNNNQEYKIDEADFVKGTQLIEGIEKGDLNKEETSGLLRMREEEKLARDVYKTLYEKWNQRIFNNISKAEQTHMDAIGTLLTRYDIQDPIKDDTVGKFTSKELQDLYNKLVVQGNKSLGEALTVGATIEDLDIYDLERFLKDVDQEDIKIVYQNLNKGSRNHMRAFIRNLERNGDSYTPQYISQSRFSEILSGEQERGSVDSSGKASESRNGKQNGQGNKKGQGNGNGQGGR